MFKKPKQATKTINIPYGEYKACAFYAPSMDFIEFMMVDDIAVERRIDEYLTLIYDLERINVIGFKLKGLRHFYDEVLLPQISDLDEDDFLPLMEIFNEIVALRGPEICENINKEAYDEVKNMMNKNNIKMTVGELQRVAA